MFSGGRQKDGGSGEAALTGRQRGGSGSGGGGRGGWRRGRSWRRTVDACVLESRAQAPEDAGRRRRRRGVADGDGVGRAGRGPVGFSCDRQLRSAAARPPGVLGSAHLKWPVGPCSI